MSSPRKPRGPPPTVGAGGAPPRPGGPPRGPPGAQVLRGVGAPSPNKGGPSAPSGPPSAFKPAPVAPPPRSLLSSARPDVDSIKGIQQAPRGGVPPPRGLPGQMISTPRGGAPPMPGNLPGRGLPPRGLAADFKAAEYVDQDRIGASVSLDI